MKPRPVAAGPLAGRVTANAAAFGVALLSVILIVAGSPPSGALTGGGDRAAVQATPAATTSRLERVDQPTSTLPRFALTIVTASPAATARLVVHGLTRGRAAFDDSIGDEGLLGPVLLRTERVPVRETATPGERSATLSLDLGEGAPGAGLIAGVRPVEVELLDEDGEVVDRIVTHLVRPPDELPPTERIAVTVVVPMAAANPLPARGPAAVDATSLDRLGALIDVVERHDGSPRVLAPSPQLVHALGEGDEPVRRVLERLRGVATDSEVVGLPFAPLDLSAWVSAGATAELVGQLDAGARLVSGLLGVEVERRWWFEPQTLDRAAVDALARAGITSVATAPDTLAPVDAGVATAFQPFVVAGVEHSLMGELVDEASARHLVDADDPLLGAERFAAELAIGYFDEPGRSRRALVLPPGPQGWEPAQLDALLTVIGGHPMLVSVGLHASAAGRVDGGRNPPPLTRSYEPVPIASLGSFPMQLTQARQRVDAYGSVIGSDHPQLLPLRLRTLAAVDRTLSPAERRAYLDAVEDAVDTDLDGLIELPVGTTITLTSRDGTLPVTVRSTDPERTVAVTVRLASDKLEFPGGARHDLVIASEAIRLDVPVRARSSGAFPLRITVTSPDETLTLSTAELTIRSTAISGVGLALSIGAMVVLVVWWTRNIRRRHALDGHGGEDDPP